MRGRIRMAGLLALLAAVVMSMSAAPAFAGHSPRAEKRQDTAIKKLRSTDTRTRRSLLRTSRSLREVSLLVSVSRGDIAAVVRDLGTIQAQVPLVGKALVDLRTGLETLAAGTKTLADGVANLGSAYSAVEYGAVRAFGRPSSAAPANEGYFELPGLSANSPDIPDDGNGALATASVPVQNPTAGAFDVTLRSAIRSNESDGNAEGDPAGQVGAIMYAKCASIPGVAATACPDGIDPGQIVCAPKGPPPPTAFPVPGGTTTQPLKNIQQKAPRSGFTNPTIDDPNPTGDQNNKCTLPGPGLYELTFAVQFFDLPPRANPGPTD